MNEALKMVARNPKSTFSKVLQRNHQHSKAFPAFFFLVLVVDKMCSRQAFKIRVSYFIPSSPAVMNDHLMNGYIRNAVEENSKPKIEAEIKAGHYTELHVQPAWYGKDQSKPIVLLNCAAIWLMMVFMQRPTEGVHDIFVRKPSNEFHRPKRGENDCDIDYYLRQRIISIKSTRAFWMSLQS